MPLKIVFLGRLEDAAGSAERSVEQVEDFESLIASFEPELASAVRDDRIRIAVNGELVADRNALVLADDDELAFLPPVSGGSA